MPLAPESTFCVDAQLSSNGAAAARYRFASSISTAKTQRYHDQQRDRTGPRPTSSTLYQDAPPRDNRKHAPSNKSVSGLTVMLRSALVFLSLTIRAAYGGECLISGPGYQLQSDTVEWQMKIRVGQSCMRGVRYNNVANPVIKIISLPRFGELTLLGPAFSYTARTDFQEEDSFIVGVSGAINKVSGTSTIRISVSIIGPLPAQSAPAAPRDRAPPPTSGQSVDAPAAPSVDNTIPVQAGASLPPCPIWDWSIGAPPPMRPPFDRSKLYCPPPPFKPPSPPVGCLCSQ
jgi:hypothetical protein